MRVTREVFYLPSILFAVWCPLSALFGETPAEAIDLALRKSYALACSWPGPASQTSLRYKQDLRELESMILKLEFLRKALDLTAEKTDNWSVTR
jgi:hypothetical protein